MRSKILEMPDSEIVFYPSFFSKERSDAYYDDLYANIAWKQEQIKLYGKQLDLPRLTAWYGDRGASYKYSGIRVKPQSWIAPLLEIKKAIESLSGNVFNSVLLNLYRQERDGVSWHSDNEPELGQNPIIGSVSFGGTRRFQFKHKKNKAWRYEIKLPHGSYLLMKGATQNYWLHQVPKETKPYRPRINLTFRTIVSKVGV